MSSTKSLIGIPDHLVGKLEEMRTKIDELRRWTRANEKEIDHCQFQPGVGGIDAIKDRKRKEIMERDCRSLKA